MRALGVAGAVAIAAAAACLNTSEPRGFLFQYEIGVYACDSIAGCSEPDSNTAIDSAAPRDTVWVRHDLQLILAASSTSNARIRPDCDENVVVVFGSAAVQTLPDPVTCADSTALRLFEVGELFTVFTQWIIDSTLAPGNTYAVAGRVMVQPRIEPVYAFVIE